MATNVDLAPLLQLLLGAALLASLPLAFLWLRRRRERETSRFAVLTGLVLFLTFDLIVFGAFTRLSDSGLGCPDWPGCYGHASPIGAQQQIAAEQQALPDGPVTHGKAWIEMVHRYLAMTVGALIVVLVVVAWLDRARLPMSPWWATASLGWVVVQGLFGKYTVTMKLYPAIVTAHLLGGLALLALLAIQRETALGRRAALDGRLRHWVGLTTLLLLVQITLGGWVSTNYAVLACRGFPLCNGQWWPAMDFDAGFEVMRHLGRSGDGALLGFEALVAIHMAHRLFAVVAVAAAAATAWWLWRCADASVHRAGGWLGVLLAMQLATGLSNVVFDWPLAAALLHSAGAAALLLVLVQLLVRARTAPARLPLRSSAAVVPRARSEGPVA